MGRKRFYLGAACSDSRQDASSSIMPAVVDEKKASPVAMAYRSELDFISRCILDYQDIETGGQLFGFWTGQGIPVVMYATGPGPKAVHRVTSFIQDPDYLSWTGRNMICRYGLQHIGEWHSHHRLGLARPSGQDASNMVQVVRGCGLRHFLLCIGNCTSFNSVLNAFCFHENDTQNYVHAAWRIVEMESPFRAVVDRELASNLVFPRTFRPSHGSFYLEHENTVSNSRTPSYRAGYWLSEKENNKVLKRICDYLSFHDPYTKVTVNVDHEGLVHLDIDRGYRMEEIVFGRDFPYAPPKIEVAYPYVCPAASSQTVAHDSPEVSAVISELDLPADDETVEREAASKVPLPVEVTSQQSEQVSDEEILADLHTLQSSEAEMASEVVDSTEETSEVETEAEPISMAESEPLSQGENTAATLPKESQTQTPIKPTDNMEEEVGQDENPQPAIIQSVETVASEDHPTDEEVKPEDETTEETVIPGNVPADEEVKSTYEASGESVATETVPVAEAEETQAPTWYFGGDIFQSFISYYICF